MIESILLDKKKNNWLIIIMSNKYNNKELAKLNLVENLNNIRRRNQDISSISILFLQSVTFNNSKENTNIKKTYLKIIPDISICIKDKYILKYHYENNFFTYHNKSEKFIENLKISPFENKQHYFQYQKNKIYYFNKNRINCNKFHSLFETIINSLNTSENYQEEKNKNFYFDFTNNEKFENEINIFYGLELCHNLFSNELDLIIPKCNNNYNNCIKF